MAVAVTAGLAVFNGEDHLDKALQSLSEQTFQDMKVLISDNCSTDRTPAIIEKWANKDNRFEVHTQEENIGPIGNFKYLLDAAESPWFMFAAHDDVRSPNYVEELYKNALSRSGVTLSVPHICQILEGARPGERKEIHYPFNEEIDGLTGVARSRLLMKSVRPGWYYALFDRETLQQQYIKALNFGQPWAHDLVLLLPFLVSGNVVGTNNTIFYQLATQRSPAYYEPKTARDQYVLYKDFWRSMISVLRDANLSRFDKLTLVSAIIRYARHAGKATRIVKTWIREQFKQRSSKLRSPGG